MTLTATSAPVVLDDHTYTTYSTDSELVGTQKITWTCKLNDFPNCENVNIKVQLIEFIDPCLTVDLKISPGFSNLEYLLGTDAIKQNVTEADIKRSVEDCGEFLWTLEKNGVEINANSAPIAFYQIDHQKYTLMIESDEPDKAKVYQLKAKVKLEDYPDR